MCSNVGKLVFRTEVDNLRLALQILEIGTRRIQGMETERNGILDLRVSM